MHWTRHRTHYTTTLGEEPVSARRVPGGWHIDVGSTTLRVANPHLKIWMHARPVIEQILRARTQGAAKAPTTPSWH